MAQKHFLSMNRLILLFVVLPLMACSQSDDLGFWAGTPEKIPGCKQWVVKSRTTDPVNSFSLTIVDCYGNEQRIGPYLADGSTYIICSMDTPIPSIALNVQSITQTGWCTTPSSTSWPFWLDATQGIMTDVIKTVQVYSSDINGTNRNLLYTTTNINSIIGQGNATTITDTYSSQNFYILRITARSYIYPGSLRIYVRPGTSQSLVFTNFNSDETKEVVFEKKQFYIGL